MLRSMTGFGEAERATAAGRVRVELRTVNHRYLHVNARLATPLVRYEPELREWLRAFFPRGAVTCTVRLEPLDAGAAGRPVRVDTERVAAYLAAFQQISDRFPVAGAPDLALLARYNDIFLRDDEVGEEEVAVPAEELRAAVEAAAAQTLRMREEEGARLLQDLEGRLHAIEAALARIAAYAPERLVAERERLRQAVAELAGGVALDEARLAQEVVLLAERWDINEELVRFRAHVDAFRALLHAEAEEPVGKRLAFLVQEMHREANTTGSKANDSRIAHQVVAIKDEIERLREQVENVE